MKDLSRLLDEQGTDELEADLLRLARSEGPSGESRRRILTGLGVAVAASTVSQSSAAASSSGAGTVAVASHSALKWGIFGTVVVGAAAVALLILGHHAPKPLTPANPVVLAAPAPAPAPAPAAAPQANGDSAQVTKLEDLPTLPDSSASDAAHAAAPSLADEVAAIKSAKTALASGNAADSLRQLDAYRVHFPHGRLSQEASVVRIEALLKSGNQATANAAADRFLAAHADSPYASRVHTLIGR
jgi:outer membrane lipoprotein YfiO